MWFLPLNPIDAILFRMEQIGMKQKDLGELIGGANRASEVIHGKRKLTIKMISTLSKKLNIPLKSLLSWVWCSVFYFCFIADIQQDYNAIFLIRLCQNFSA